LKASPFFSGVPEESQAPFIEYAGTFANPGSGLSATGQYRWKLLTNLNYSFDKFGIGLQWQHLPSIESGSTNTGYPAYDVFNLNGFFVVTDDIRLRFGVDNLFDRGPVFGNISTTANPAFFQLPGGGLDTNNNDILGRRFYFGATAKF
jgi:outer membrane receptor protein involved in Fe transport